MGESVQQQDSANCDMLSPALLDDGITARTKKQRKEHNVQRRCIISHDIAEPSDMVRLVLGPDNQPVADLFLKLPGRGAWLMLDQARIQKAATSGQLMKVMQRAFKGQVRSNKAGLIQLVAQIDAGLEQRVAQTLSLVRRAGCVITGFDSVNDMLGNSKVDVRMLVEANDGGDDGRRKLQARYKACHDGRDIAVFDLLSRTVLSQALGVDNCVHAGVFIKDRATHTGLVQQLLDVCGRLRQWRLNTGIDAA